MRRKLEIVFGDSEGWVGELGGLGKASMMVESEMVERSFSEMRVGSWG